MSKTVIAVLAFAGGVASGLLIAKLYARQRVTDLVHQGLEDVGLGGGYVENLVQSVVVPKVVS
jgi:hypothetical protein